MKQGRYGVDGLMVGIKCKGMDEWFERGEIRREGGKENYEW